METKTGQKFVKYGLLLGVTINGVIPTHDQPHLFISNHDQPLGLPTQDHLHDERQDPEQTPFRTVVAMSTSSAAISTTTFKFPNLVR